MKSEPFDSVQSARNTFFKVFGVTLLIKLGLAAWLPFTGDEAFFYQWGVRPQWGYSDHPPMVGWLIWLLRHLGDSPLALRSATALLTSVIALAVVDLGRRLLPPEREHCAWLAGAVYLALPFSWLFVLVTTDTPLILFMTASWWCFVRGELTGLNTAAGAAKTSTRPALHAAGWYAAAGTFMGMAFLSKYFAVLLGLGYALWLLGWSRERVWALALIVGCALPGVAINLAFNATHGWPNIMFNVYNRNQGTHWSVADFAIYLAMMAYLLTPWLMWQCLRTGSPAAGAGLATPRAASLRVLVLWAAPFLLFAFVATRRSVGLHWVLGFVPLFVLWAGMRLSPEALRRSLRWTGWLAVPHALLLFALFLATVATRGEIDRTVAAVLSATLVLLASRGRLPVLTLRPLVFFGAISYPLYLVHEKIGWAVLRGLEKLGLANVLR
jgi:4-amino-4-deoxy-L-arabinose transferase-like glycosyltransferase